MIVIQNADRVVKASEFTDASVLHVTTIFRTIQGEGPFAGQSAIFIRLAGCNWGAKSNGICEFCDSFFAIDKATKFDVSELAAHVRGLYKAGDIVVVTGGEPTLQADALLSLIIELEHKYDIHTQIETNGTQAKFFSALSDRGDIYPTIVVSPKANERTKKYPTLPFAIFEDMGIEDLYLKFLISADPESVYHTLPSEALHWASENNVTVYVSPMAVYKKAYQGEVSSAWDHELINAEATAANYSYAAQYVLENPGLKLSIQQHLFAAIA